MGDDEITAEAQRAFESALALALGPWVHQDRANAQALWSALANIVWTGPEGQRAAFTFREAGHIVAALWGTGSYLDWYCNGPPAVVRDVIAAAMLREGWSSAQHPADPEEGSLDSPQGMRTFLRDEEGNPVEVRVRRVPRS